MVQQPKVLNVAEKPSVARALADVFSRMPGARSVGTQRDVHLVSTHENVQFPSVYAQGEGRLTQGPGTIPLIVVWDLSVNALCNFVSGGLISMPCFSIQ
jgi:hypothetical protein